MPQSGALRAFFPYQRRVQSGRQPAVEIAQRDGACVLASLYLKHSLQGSLQKLQSDGSLLPNESHARLYPRLATHQQSGDSESTRAPLRGRQQRDLPCAADGTHSRGGRDATCRANHALGLRGAIDAAYVLASRKHLLVPLRGLAMWAPSTSLGMIAGRAAIEGETVYLRLFLCAATRK